MKRLVFVALAATLVASPVLAKPPGGVPPGLAKKPGGLPPGQAKKIYQRGERLPLTYLQSQYYVTQPVRYHLDPAPPGYRWVLVDENAYLANTQTGLIANVILDLLAR
jgi:Ni/Co efflux regulator RcnB